MLTHKFNGFNFLKHATANGKGFFILADPFCYGDNEIKLTLQYNCMLTNAYPTSVPSFNIFGPM